MFYREYKFCSACGSRLEHKRDWKTERYDTVTGEKYFWIRLRCTARIGSDDKREHIGDTNIGYWLKDTTYVPSATT